MEISAPTATLQYDVCIYVLTLSLDLDEPPEWVWRHLVDPAAAATWTPCVPDAPITRTGAVTLRENPDDEGARETVLEVEDGELLTHTWGHDTLSWIVEPFGPFSTLMVRHTTGSRESALDCLAGWHLCLEVLARRAAGEDAPRVVGAAAMEHGWRELRERYAARFADVP